MTHIAHELKDEFPNDALLIDRLVQTDYEFGRLARGYDAVNRQIYLIESEDAPTSDEVLEELKKQRLKFKDEIAEALSSLKHRM
ncbi:MAG: YdcH family protein [Methylovirgula sp.]